MQKEQLKIIKIEIDKITPYKNNAKLHPKEQIEQIKQSIIENGFNDPIAVWGENNIIVEGHGRLIACKELGYTKIECIRLDHLTDEQRRAYTLTHNKTTMNSGFDEVLLNIELEELQELDVDVIGFEFDEINANETQVENIGDSLDENRKTLQDKFIIPPFSILDTRQGYWQDRKRVWKKIIKSDLGRDDGLLGKGLKELSEKFYGANESLTGTSIFDPVLCEMLINWFCPKQGKVLDPFAGGSVRGLVSVLLGNEYTGIDLSEKQIKANYENYKAIADRQNFLGGDLKKPNWINDDSANIDLLVKEKHDFLLTCPPYADLEVYSDDPQDLSNMPYDKFKEAYTEIIIKSVAKLKENAFAAIVVGDVRDKKGYYRGFVPDTIAAFKKAGMHYYNECILIEQIGTGAMRAGRQFNARRKVVKTHQNVLIFIKGDEKELMNELNIYEYDFSEVAADVETA